MASYNIICAANTSNVSVNLQSTKVKVLANVACYYAIGNNSPVAYTSGNCAAIPGGTIRDINCGPGNVTAGTGPKIAFIPQSGAALIEITEVGTVDFTKVSN